MGEQAPKSKTTKINKAWPRRAARKAVIVLVAIVVLTVIAIMPKRNGDAPVTEAAPVNVAVMPVVSEPNFADTFELPAVVEPNRIIAVSAEVSGRIEQIPPKKGSVVKAGDLLIQLNTDLVRPEYEIAKARVERDQIEYERMANLVREDATSRRDLDDATTDLAISKATLEEVKARLERTRILSPISGPLNNLLVEVGEYVQPGTAVAEIVDMDVLKVVVEIPERDVGFFSVGQKAEVFLNTVSQGKSLAGTITFISELADERTRTTRLEITVRDERGLLRSGQIVRARLTRGILDGAILIPLLAVIPMERGHAVYVVNSEEAERREVELGIIRGDRVQVTRGLESGDRLIIAGHRFLAPGQKVNVVSENR